MRTVALFISSALLLGAAIPPSLSALCPKPVAGEITVCADQQPKRSPYRIPDEIPRHEEYGTRASDSVSRERNALFDYDSGGGQSCDHARAGGDTGCALNQFKDREHQRAGSKNKHGWNYDDPY